jgi:hypothetical protein
MSDICSTTDCGQILVQINSANFVSAGNVELMQRMEMTRERDAALLPGGKMSFHCPG